MREVRLPVPRLSMPQLWMALAVLLPILAALIAPLSTVDLAYQVRAGDLIAQQGDVLRTDPFTFTVGGQPWFDQQWLSQLKLAAAFEVSGWAGLAVLRALCVAVIFAVVAAGCLAVGASTRVAAGLTLASFFVAVVSLGLRPQLFGMVLFAAVQLIVLCRHRNPRWLWLVPLVTALWASVHGSFFFGPLILAAAAATDFVSGRPDARRLAVLAVLSVVAACVTPFGPAVWVYAVELSTNPTVRGLVTEWQPTQPLTFAGIALYSSVVVVAVVIARRRREVPWPSIAWLIVLAVLAAASERAIAWWALAAPAVIAPLLSRPRSPARAERRSLAAAGIAFAVLALAVVVAPVWRAGHPRFGPPGLLVDAPVKATEAGLGLIAAGDRVFNAQRWGSWLEFAWPETRVFVDSRIELFPPAVFADYAAVSEGRSDWAAILDRWQVSVLLIDPDEQAGLAGLARTSGSWRVVVDDDALLAVRAER